MDSNKGPPSTLAFRILQPSATSMRVGMPFLHWFLILYPFIFLSDITFSQQQCCLVDLLCLFFLKNKGINLTQNFIADKRWLSLSENCGHRDIHRHRDKHPYCIGIQSFLHSIPPPPPPTPTPPTPPVPRGNKDFLNSCCQSKMSLFNCQK